MPPRPADPCRPRAANRPWRSGRRTHSSHRETSRPLRRVAAQSSRLPRRPQRPLHDVDSSAVRTRARLNLHAIRSPSKKMLLGSLRQRSATSKAARLCTDPASSYRRNAPGYCPNSIMGADVLSLKGHIARPVLEDLLKRLRTTRQWTKRLFTGTCLGQPHPQAHAGRSQMQPVSFVLRIGGNDIRENSSPARASRIASGNTCLRA